MQRLAVAAEAAGNAQGLGRGGLVKPLATRWWYDGDDDDDMVMMMTYEARGKGMWGYG